MKLIVAFHNFCESPLKPAANVHDVLVSSLILSFYLIFSVPLNTFEWDPPLTSSVQFLQYVFGKLHILQVRVENARTSRLLTYMTISTRYSA